MRHVVKEYCWKSNVHPAGSRMSKLHKQWQIMKQTSVFTVSVNVVGW